MVKYGISGIAILGAIGVAAAQEEGAEPSAAPPVSELDLLSRSADDPFAGVIEKEKRQPISVTLRALDKITARYTDLEIEMNQIARFGALEIQPRYCDKRPPEDFPETTAFLEIFDTEFGQQESNFKSVVQEQLEEEIEVEEIAAAPAPTAVGDLPTASEVADAVLEGPQAEGINIFRGWMFASTPALNPLEHAVYDVWVIDCNTRIVDN